MDPNGPTASALQSEFGFIPGRATPGTYPKLQQIITGAHCPSGSGWRSDDTTPRVLHSSDDGSTPRSRSELSFHSWALSGQSSAQASSLRSETPTSNGHAPILADVCMSRGQGSTASCGGAAATTQPSSHETPNREENLLKRALPREPSQDQHGDSSTPVQPGIKKAKKERRPGPEDHLPWTERKIRRAKRAARSELSVTRGEWQKHNYAQSNVLSLNGIQDTVERVHISDLTQEQFVERFERPRIPVVITGLTDSWEAADQWTPAALRTKFGEHAFKVGSDDDGYSVRMKLKHFLRYLSDEKHAPSDDSPLYVFDGTFADRAGSKSMAGDYQVPPLWQEDLFQHVGERRRPPYRWFVMGPARSGSGLHIDPLATSAWNALVTGTKRWALFPPGTPRSAVLPREPGIEREAASWFSQIYPRTEEPSWHLAKPLNIIQRAGETVWVPGGWWHTVLNLDLTVAVTQNYVSSTNFPQAWRHVKRGRPKMSAKLLRVLEGPRPDLAAAAAAAAATGQDASGSSSPSSSSSSSSSSDSGHSTSSSSSSSSGSSSSSDEDTDDGGNSCPPLTVACP